MSNPFPFPVPKELEPRIMDKMLGEMLFFTQLGSPGNANEPQLLSLLDALYVHFDAIANGMDFLIHSAPVPGSPEETSYEEAVEANLLALKSQVSQLGGVITWARQTWEYDPAIIGARETTPEGGEQEDAPSSESQEQRPADVISLAG